MRQAEALERLRDALDPWPPVVQELADGGPTLAVFVTRDLLHLDADELHDRLQVWLAREVRPHLPDATAAVDFLHARSARPDERAQLDVQERWIGLRARFDLELIPATTAAEIERFASMADGFLAAVYAHGRPKGYRDPEEGNAE